MELHDWRALRELMALRSRLREVVERALLPPSAAVVPTVASFTPVADIWETAEAIVIEVELPGLAATSVDLRLEGTNLTLTGEMPPHDDTNGTYLRIERSRGRFQRTIVLPDVATGTPEASLRNGILEIRIPRDTIERRQVAIVKEGP
jgi:HSP20 family protein